MLALTVAARHRRSGYVWARPLREIRGLTNRETGCRLGHDSVDTNGDGLSDGAALAWGLTPGGTPALLIVSSPVNGRILP